MRFAGIQDLLLFACCVILTSHSSVAQKPRTSGTPQKSDTRVHVPLIGFGLPNDFFRQTKNGVCDDQIISYRFVTWLSNSTIAVGFSASPSCRPAKNQRVDGVLRILVFDINGSLKTKRDLSYLADGNGEIVADGEAEAGPQGTLLVRLQSVNLTSDGRKESESAIRLLDADLKDVTKVDRFLMQTTLAGHAMVFADGPHGDYTIWPSANEKDARSVTPGLPTGTRSRSAGDDAIAFAACTQQVQPGKYTASNVIYSGAETRCTLHVKPEHGSEWSTPLKDGQVAEILGVLADGSVVAVIRSSASQNEALLLFAKGVSPVQLPGVAPAFAGKFSSSTADFSRYSFYATDDARACNPLTSILGGCDRPSQQQWILLDRKLPQPLVNRTLSTEARASLAPDGAHYATLEDGEFRVYDLPPAK